MTITITLDLEAIFSGGMVLLLLLVPVAWATHRERTRYIERVYGEKEIAL